MFKVKVTMKVQIFIGSFILTFLYQWSFGVQTRCVDVLLIINKPSTITKWALTVILWHKVSLGTQQRGILPHKASKLVITNLSPLCTWSVSVQPMPRGDHVLNFSDVEDKLKDEDLKLVLFDLVLPCLLGLTYRIWCAGLDFEAG